MNDASTIEPFERTYTERFRSFVEQFGHILAWEHVGSVRDIWLQLIYEKSPGDEQPLTTLCSFCLHSISATDLDPHAYHQLREVTVPFETQHLRYWHFQPLPTYLVIYIESVDEFLWLNIQHHIQQTWRQTILRPDRKTETVGVPRDSVLDRKAFEKILAENDMSERRKIFENKRASNMGWLHEVGDYEVIWRVGTADARRAVHALHFETFSDPDGYEGCYMFLEEAICNRAYEIRTFRIPDSWIPVEEHPYLDCLELVHSETRSKQVSTFRSVRLNQLGKDLFAAVQALERFGLLALSPGFFVHPTYFNGQASSPNAAPTQDMSDHHASGSAAVALNGATPAVTLALQCATPPIARHPLDAKAPDVVRVLEEDGTVDPAKDPGLKSEELFALYRAMVRTRMLNERLHMLMRQGHIAMHLGCRGEEASILGSTFAMRTNDWIFPGYREFAAALWRGMPLQRYIDHKVGNANDPAKGRPFAGYYTWRSGRIVSVGSPLGARITQAAGFAWAAKLRRDDVAVLAYLGDGLTSSSAFHNGMNFAGVFKAPVVFFCRNNGWAQTTPTERQTASDTFAQKGLAYGVPFTRVDGNDLFAVIQVTRNAVARAARGEGPTLIEAVTYRVEGHATQENPRVYRPDHVVEPWRRLDPLLRLRFYMERMPGWTRAHDNSLEDEFDAELKTALKAAEATPPPPLGSLFEDTFGELPWHLVEQQEELLRGPRVKA